MSGDSGQTNGGSGSSVWEIPLGVVQVQPMASSGESAGPGSGPLPEWARCRQRVWVFKR